MDLDTYRKLQAQARSLTRTREDAEDLLHETLLAACMAGRDDAPWLAGVLRKQAALAVRVGVRRRAREAAQAVDGAPLVSPADAPSNPAALLARLPPSARRLAVLLLHGLDGEEIRWILGIADTAFRQRLSRIRRALAELSPAAQAELREFAAAPDRARSLDADTGLLRRALRAALGSPGGMGTHDPDGHLLVLRNGAHSPAPGGN